MKSLLALAIALMPIFGMADIKEVSANSIPDNLIAFSKRGVELKVGEIKAWMARDYNADVRIMGIEDTIFNYMPGRYYDSQKVINFELSKDDKVHQVSCYLKISFDGVETISIDECESGTTGVSDIFSFLDRITKVPSF